VNEPATGTNTGPRTLLDKVWSSHRVRGLRSGQDQLFIDTHLIHEVTSPQAFDMLANLGIGVAMPERTFGTVDHIVPTHTRVEPYEDPLADAMIKALRRNVAANDITFFDVGSGQQGIVHMVGPEQGITQPGSTIACGDSHTSTHGAFGAIAFGIGTSQVRDVLATQTIAMSKPKLRRIEVNGELHPGVFAKDVILHIIRTLGVHGGIGYAYEYAGSTIEAMSMEERMTICNMSIEGGARCGYVNPDQTTFDYLEGRPFSPTGDAWREAVEQWKQVASDPGCHYDDVVIMNAADVPPTVTWGINPGQAIAIDERVPTVEGAPESERDAIAEALAHMQLEGGSAIAGTPIDVAFFGSCTNARLSDFMAVARVLEGRRVAEGVKAIAVPGSQLVKAECERLGIDKVFRDAGFEWRDAGCSMCLAMNPDKLIGDQLCASSSNRNFKGRQGSPTGRTVLMSPVMVAAAAVTGVISDARTVFAQGAGAVA